MFIQTKSPKITGVITFTTFYTLGFLFYALAANYHKLLPSLAVHVVVIAFVCIAHNRVRYPLSLLWNLSMLGVLYLAGNAIIVPTFDKQSVELSKLCILSDWLSYSALVHGYALAVITWLNWQTLCNIIHNRYQRRLMPSGGLLLLVVTSAIGYGLIGEGVVTLGDACFSTDYVIDYYHLCVGAVANCIGALLAALLIKLRNL